MAIWVSAHTATTLSKLWRPPTSAPLRSYDPMGWEYPSWAHINGPAVNLLKGGILTADRVMTVSKVRPGVGRSRVQSCSTETQCAEGQAQLGDARH